MVAGLVLALVIVPMIAVAFRLAFVPMNFSLVFVREIAMLAAAGLVLVFVRKIENQPWSSIGLISTSTKQFALGTTVGLVACAVATVVGILLVQALALPMGGAAGAYKPGVGLLSFIVLRAGIVEELCFRGYAITRLEALTHSRVIAVGLPLLIFAGFHASQGVGGILLAFFLGGVMSWLFLWKRNLWINMTVHFLVDFIPNVLLANVLN